MVDRRSQRDREALTDRLRARIAGTLARHTWFQHRGDHGDAAIELLILKDLKAQLALADPSIRRAKATCHQGVPRLDGAAFG